MSRDSMICDTANGQRLDIHGENGQGRTDDGENSVRSRRVLVEVGLADAPVVLALFQLLLDLFWTTDRYWWAGERTPGVSLSEWIARERGLVRTLFKIVDADLAVSLMDRRYELGVRIEQVAQALVVQLQSRNGFWSVSACAAQPGPGGGEWKGGGFLPRDRRRGGRKPGPCRRRSNRRSDRLIAGSHRGRCRCRPVERVRRAVASGPI
jgi:hypothetical protein